MTITKKNITTYAILFAVIVGSGLLSSFLPSNIERTVSEAMIMLVMVIGLNIYVGNSGVFSFGHAAFVMIGAYAQAWQTCCEMLKPITLSGLPDFLLYNSFPTWSALLMSGLASAIVALAVGLVLLRLSGLAAAIASFAFLSIMSVIYSNLDTITGGTGSIIGIPPSIPDYGYAAIAAIFLLIALIFKESRFGLMLRASREDYYAAKASGIRVYLLRLVAFVLSCFVSGVAGGMLAHFLGILSVNEFYLSLTMSVIAMMVIGGAGSVTGTVVGVAVITLLNEIMRLAEKGFALGSSDISLPTGSQQVALGLFLLLILLFKRNGLTAGKEIGDFIFRKE